VELPTLISALIQLRAACAKNIKPSVIDCIQWRSSDVTDCFVFSRQNRSHLLITEIALQLGGFSSPNTTNHRTSITTMPNA